MSYLWTQLSSTSSPRSPCIASLLVVAQGNPMHSVMLLIMSFGALAGLYVLLDAPFTAVTQIIIYAGAIMVLFLFVVMLLNVPREEPVPRRVGAAGADRHARSALSCRCCSASRWSGRCGAWAGPVLRRARRDAPSVRSRGSARRFSRVMRSRSKRRPILILVAMIGAVVLARKEQS